MATKPEQDIAEFETLLRQLEKEYDKFFCGLERKEPTVTENKVLAIVRAYAGRPLQNPTLGFKYTSLVARYNSFRTVWSRKLREREEGRVLGSCSARPVTPPRPEPRHPVRTAANPGEYLSSDPLHEPRRLEQFFETYRRLREESGESSAKLRVESFQKALAEKVEKIKREQRCEAVLIRVVSEQGRTRIVAKPFRRPAKTPGSAP
ncbi:MAG: MXAN_5187 C-terminal domain-containing protein [Candidatus Methylomirabilia bacterium]